MAFVSQEDKKRLSPGIKAVLKKYDMKGTIRTEHHSKLVVTLKSGRLDIMGASKQGTLDDPRWDLTNEYDVLQLNAMLNRKFMNINHYWIEENYGSDSEVVSFLKELVIAMKGPDYFDESDSQTDYFHCSHYLGIDVGRGYDKPYECTGTEKTFERVEVQESA